FSCWRRHRVHRQERHDRPCFELTEQVGLNVEQVTAGSPSKNVVASHQNCRYSSSGMPCSSTYSFHDSMAVRFSSFHRRAFSAATASAIPASAARDALMSRSLASFMRCVSIDKLVGRRATFADDLGIRYLLCIAH